MTAQMRDLFDLFSLIILLGKRHGSRLDLTLVVIEEQVERI